MTKRSNRSTNRTESTTGGRVVKGDNGAASIAPEGTVQSPAEAHEAETAGQPAPAAEPETEQPAEQQPEPTPVEQGEPQPAESVQAEQQAADGDQPEEATVTEVNEAADNETPDPFADLPTITLGEYTLRDLSGVESVAENDPFKYAEVHKAAKDAKLHVKSGWKHAGDMITAGRVTREFKPTSVYGTIDQLVRAHGRAGIPAVVLVSEVRRAQIGNKRSKYCTALPPIGWAEGWIDTYISKGHGRVMEKKAPPVTVEQAQELNAAEQEAERKAA